MALVLRSSGLREAGFGGPGRGRGIKHCARCHATDHDVRACPMLPTTVGLVVARVGSTISLAAMSRAHAGQVALLTARIADLERDNRTLRGELRIALGQTSVGPTKCS